MAKSTIVIQNFFRGDTRKYRLLIKDGETGNPISVDGGKLFVTFKSKIELPDADAELQVITDCTEADPANPTGEILVVLSAEATNIPINSYYFDFQFVSSSGEVTTIIPQEHHINKVRVLQDTTLDNT